MTHGLLPEEDEEDGGAMGRRKGSRNCSGPQSGVYSGGKGGTGAAERGGRDTGNGRLESDVDNGTSVGGKKLAKRTLPGIEADDLVPLQ